MTLASTREAIDRAEAQLIEDVRAAGYNDTCQFAIRLATEEALSNAMVHGNRHDPEKSIFLAYDVTPTHAHLEIADEGEGFDPARVPDPTEDDNLELPSGRGLVLMRAYMTSVEYLDRGTRIRMTFERPDTDPQRD